MIRCNQCAGAGVIFRCDLVRDPRALGIVECPACRGARLQQLTVVALIAGVFVVSCVLAGVLL